MKKLFLTLIIISFISCGKDKVVQLPEISHSEVSAISDVSAAYLFYDETQPDSVELNRRNLISTTNWLVNIDKRLTLKQVIPHIQFLQEKKSNASHKNETSKNYFSCHDTSQQNLGFIEFTDVVYKKESIMQFIGDEIFRDKNSFIVYYATKSNIQISPYRIDKNQISSNILTLKDDLISLGEEFNTDIHITLSFNSAISFQDYISMKSLVAELSAKNLSITDIEFISD